MSGIFSVMRSCNGGISSVDRSSIWGMLSVHQHSIWGIFSVDQSSITGNLFRKVVLYFTCRQLYWEVLYRDVLHSPAGEWCCPWDVEGYTGRYWDVL